MTLNKFRTKELTWDKAGKQIYESIGAHSGDSNGRKLLVQVLDGGVITDLSGVQLYLSWKSNTDNHKGLDAFKAVNLSEGIFEIAYTTEMLSNVGKLRASLVLIDEVGRVESNLFTITVSQSNVDDESVQSEDSFTALTEALVTVCKYDTRISGVENSKADKAEVESLTAQLAQNITRTESIFDIKTLGIVGDGSIDETEKLQEIVDYSRNENIKVINYDKNLVINISKPIYFDGGEDIDFGYANINKTTNTKGEGSSVLTSRTDSNGDYIVDDYGVDAHFIF